MNPLTLLVVCALLIFFLFCPAMGVSFSKGPFLQIVIAFAGILEDKIASLGDFLTWIFYYKKTVKPSIAVAINNADKRYYADVSHFLVVVMGFSVAWTWSKNIRELTEAERKAIAELVAKELGDHESSSEVCSE